MADPKSPVSRRAATHAARGRIPFFGLSIACLMFPVAAAEDGPGPAMRLRVISEEGVFLVYDAARPAGEAHATPGFVGYWNDYQGEALYVYPQLLFERIEVGHALLNLERDLGIDAGVLIERQPTLQRALTDADSEPEDPTAWFMASYETILEVMGFQDGNSGDGPWTNLEATAGVICPPPPPPPGGTTSLSPLKPPGDNGSPEWIITAALQGAGCGCTCNDDGNPCTYDYCSSGNCIHPAKTGSCPDDGNVCTDDYCSNGQCTHPNNINPCQDDGNPCTYDKCSLGTCKHQASFDFCDDGDVCTEGDICQAFIAGEAQDMICAGSPDESCLWPSCPTEFIVDGDGKATGFPYTRTGRVIIPQGTSCVSVQVYYFSREYPQYTGGQSEFDDKLRFRVSYPNGTIASGWTSVNALHDFFDTGRYPGGNYLAADRVIRFDSLTGTEGSWIEVRAVAMNVSDAFLGSGVAIVIDCRIIDLDIEGVSEGAETNPGGFVCLNDDDDNNNNVPDKDETGAITGEDDLLVLSTSVADGLTGTVTLSAPAGGTRIRVYENSNRSGLIGLARSWSVDQLPSKFYVEGVSRSEQAGDVTMRLKFGGRGTVCKDEIKLTVTPTTTVPGNYDTVEIRYKTFIACNAIQTDPNPFLYDYFKGDNRNFSFAGGPSRTYLNFKGTVDPSIATGQVGAVAKQFGQTRGYDNEGNNNDIDPCSLGVCDSYCEFCITPTATAECTATAQFGVGGNVLDANYTRISTSEIEVVMDVVGKNPCATGGPGIDAHITFRFRQLCTNGVLDPLEYRITGGWHDAYPWHELYLKGVAIYKFDPCANFRTPNPNDLLDPIFGGQNITILDAKPTLGNWQAVP